ncbi:adenylate/guanylate cyclase domain-containing protein [uncultured Ottowia sp.]|uniref:adenylate/guanylate cyclase domain-containing protein n=1 Tax=uncultured Ottowia sp. TaxID=543067 RepID=UPI0025914353|nr:adenylate/guanylate cyclase domain-containing protein [uncultured Ottowia sp.]
MNRSQTIVFIDLVGSASAFETLGNEQVAGAMARLTRWISRVCESCGGEIIKRLGDGVLAAFDSPAAAIRASMAVQSRHARHLNRWPPPMRMGLRVGMAAGEVVRLSDDVYGEALNLAARLCEMAGGGRILAAREVMEGIGPQARPPRSRPLGSLAIRGLRQPRAVFQIEWDDSASTDFLTISGAIDAGSASGMPPLPKYAITLAREGASATFRSGEMPVLLGRAPQCHFVIADPRASRQHARLEYSNGNISLADTSTYGTWVCFDDGQHTELALRRSSCVLHAKGHISLGMPCFEAGALVIGYQLRQEAA